jgi:hypothetical protein
MVTATFISLSGYMEMIMMDGLRLVVMIIHHHVTSSSLHPIVMLTLTVDWFQPFVGTEYSIYLESSNIV